MRARWLLTPIKNSRRRTWHFRRVHHNTLALSNAKHMSCSVQSGSLKNIILLDITDKFNFLTYYTEITHRPLSNFIRRSSLVLVVVPFSWMFFSCPCLCPWAGCDLALSLTCLTIHQCLFATGPEMDCSSCTLFQTNTGFLLCGRFANTNNSIHKTFAVHHARFEIRVFCAFFLCPSCR